MTNRVGESKVNNLTRRGLIVSGVAALAGGSMLTAAEAATGQISLRILSAGFIFGASGGSGVLVFEGHQYPLSIGGISAGATIGASGTDLVGTASHLRTPADINGVYTAVGAGLSVAGGRSAAQLRNANGVLLRLHGRQVGFMFSIDLSGMVISLQG